MLDKIFYRFRLVFFLFCLFIFTPVYSEEQIASGINIPNIAEKTKEVYEEEEEEEVKEKRQVNYKTFEDEDIKFRRKIWRQINLKNKANEGFFYRNKEIVKFIIDGVKKGLLVPYTSFDKKKRMSKAKFMENLLEPSSSQKLENNEEEDAWGEKEVKTIKKTPKKEYFFARQASLLVMEEELLFHSRRSEWSFDIKSVKLVLPADLFETKISREVAVFDYKELIAYLDSQPEALWRNNINASSHKKFSLAFKERLFSSVLWKIENPGDYTIAEMHGAKTEEERLIAAQKEEDKLIAFMDKIWIP